MIGHHTILRKHALRTHVAIEKPNSIKASKKNFGPRVPFEPASTIHKKETRGPANPTDPHRTPPRGRSRSPASGSTINAPDLNQGYFTVDSTREDVLALQGQPSEYNDRVFSYGNSKVYFSDGRVTGWDNSLSHPLKTRLVSSKPNMPNKGYFTVGSKKEEVLAVQGLPSGFTDHVFEYGSSKVYFSDGRVTGWDVQAGYPLEVRSVTKGQGSGGN
jgi:hypothetical protein